MTAHDPVQETAMTQQAWPLDQIHVGQSLQVMLSSRALVLVEELFLALGPWSRLRGLLGYSPLLAFQGLLLRPCNGVHSFFMRFPIDVLFLDRGGQVVAMRPELRPWRMTPLFGEAYATLELAAGQIETTAVTVGDTVRFVTHGR
jgi:uncharacterized protein